MSAIMEFANSNTKPIPLAKDADNLGVRCHIGFVPENDGTWSAIVLNLPGVGSCGKTFEEARLNVRESIVAAIESYSLSGEDIPWEDSEPSDIPDGAILRWIIVNV